MLNHVIVLKQPTGRPWGFLTSFHPPPLRSSTSSVLISPPIVHMRSTKSCGLSLQHPLLRVASPKPIYCINKTTPASQMKDDDDEKGLFSDEDEEGSKYGFTLTYDYGSSSQMILSRVNLPIAQIMKNIGLSLLLLGGIVLCFLPWMLVSTSLYLCVLGVGILATLYSCFIIPVILFGFGILVLLVVLYNCFVSPVIRWYRKLKTTPSMS